ncbi:MAG: extensin family protein [Shinella sp.]|nr:extensin family protein [Shinella sp.]
MPETRPQAPDRKEAPQQQGPVKEEDAGKERDKAPPPADGPEPNPAVDAPEPAAPVAAEDPETLKTCLAELKAMGAEFAGEMRIDDGNGCGIDRPIRLTKVAPEVALEPAGVMRCQTALALARWVGGSVVPAAKVALPQARLTAVNQASAYVCRKRNGAQTGKISEHAHGNAVDIASFQFTNGKTVPIEPRQKDSTLEGAFQRTVTASGCLWFTTVLAPGSDAAHENHLHLDVIERKGGYRYCW